MIITGRQGLALVRAGVGALFIASASNKAATGWLAGGEAMAKAIQPNLDKSEAFYRPFLQETVLPNAGTFAQLITVGEWVAGVSLLLGLLTRAGAVVGMWLLLNYMLMKGTLLRGYENGQTYSDRLYFLASLAFLLVGAGIAWGLDGALRRYLTRMPVVRWLAGIDHPASADVAPAAQPRRDWPEPTPLARPVAPPERERRAA